MSTHPIKAVRKHFPTITVWYRGSALILDEGFAEARGIEHGARWGDAEWAEHFGDHCRYMIWKIKEAQKSEGTIQ